MTWIFSVIGIICVAAIIACYNHVEKLNRIIDERQEDLKRAKAEAERKESKLLVSFSKQTSELRQKLEDMNTDLQITKAQWEWMSKEKNTLTAERDQWKERAEQATAENETLKTFQANATEEIAQLKASLSALQTEKAEWEDRYQSESQQWSQQKRELVNQIRPSTTVSPAQIASAELPAPFESAGIRFTEEGMVLGERSAAHPEQLTNALIYEGETRINPLLERTRRESTLYPALYQPGNGVPVLSPSPIRPIAAQGMIADLRDALQQALSGTKGIQLLDTVALPVRNRTYGYIPGIALYVESGHFYVDIEVDAPRSATDQPIHCLGSADHLRNLYFLENGWAVFRFAEQQVAQHKERIVDLILQQLAVLTDRSDLDREVDLEEVWLNRWSQAETTEAVTDTPFPGMSPDIDILVDHTARCQKGIDKVKGHPYTKVTLQNDYEYVFVADSLKQDTEGYERGWAVTDVIEQQKVFIPFSEIVRITYLDSLWLSPELVIGEEFAMEEWEQLGKGLKEAAYGARPIHILYQPKEGAAVEQDVLYLSHYFTQPETGEIIPWEQTAPLLFEESYLQVDFQEFAGYSLATRETQLFTAYLIKRFGLYDCHKPGACYNETDLWNCFEAGVPEIARQLYQLFHAEKRHYVAVSSEQTAYKAELAHLVSQQA